MVLKKDQASLFEDSFSINDCEKEWEDMPEYNQKDLTPYRTLYIHFRNKEDVEDFEKVIKQKIHQEAKSYWHPKLKIKEVANLRYVDKDAEMIEDES